MFHCFNVIRRCVQIPFDFQAGCSNKWKTIPRKRSDLSPDFLLSPSTFHNGPFPTRTLFSTLIVHRPVCFLFSFLNLPFRLFRVDLSSQHVLSLFCCKRSKLQQFDCYRMAGKVRLVIMFIFIHCHSVRRSSLVWLLFLLLFIKNHHSHLVFASDSAGGNLFYHPSNHPTEPLPTVIIILT